MKRSFLVPVISILTVCLLTGCGINGSIGDNKQSDESEAGSQNAEGCSLLGLITEANAEFYKVKLMGYYVNEIEMYIMVERKSTELTIDDDVILTLVGETYLIDSDGNEVKYDTTSEWGEYIADKTEVLLKGNVTQIEACENDGIFIGTVVAIEDLYNEDMEPIGAQFCIVPIDEAPEYGKFNVSNLDLGYGLDLNAQVEVTYDPNTLEIISVTQK